MTRYTLALAFLVLSAPGNAYAKCSDEIIALQDKAKQTDQINKPGEQKQTSDPQTTAGNEGGGTQSASAKILEAQAHDQRGDEDLCMKAINEAKSATDRK